LNLYGQRKSHGLDQLATVSAARRESSLSHPFSRYIPPLDSSFESLFGGLNSNDYSFQRVWPERAVSKPRRHDGFEIGSDGTAGNGGVVQLRCYFRAVRGAPLEGREHGKPNSDGAAEPAPSSPWQKSPVAETGGASPSAALLVG
jgi:hypothetical protein